MANLPIPGQNYTVKTGDTLTALAVRAYGNAYKWTKIYRANMSQLRSGNPDLIFPGEVIFIPADEEKAQVLAVAREATFTGKDPHDFTVILDGLEVPVQNGRFGNSMDSVIDEWTGTHAWTPGLDPELDRRVSLKTGKYCPCQLYLGNNLALTGRIYNIKNSRQGDKRLKFLRGDSLTADVVDSDMRPPLEWGGLNLKQMASEVLGPMGYKVTFIGKPGSPFDYVKANRTEKAFAFISRLAVQRGFLVRNDEYGNVVIAKADTAQPPVGTLTEDEPGCPVTSWEIEENFRDRFHTYEVVGQSGDADDQMNSSATDLGVPASRRIAYMAGDIDNGSIQDSAKWRRSRALCKALTFNLPVDSWYAPNGKLWSPDTMVRIVSSTLELNKGFTFSITNVEFEKNDNSHPAILSLAPPQSLTGEDLVEPWS